MTIYPSIAFAFTYLRLWGVKSFGYFGQVIDRLTRDLYEGTIDELEFVQVFEDLLAGQLRDAWMEGMAQNNLTEEDMTPEFETELGEIISVENAEVLDFADAIATSATENATTENHQEALDALLARADLWQMRYTDVVNQAALFTANKEDRYGWFLGATEQHCDSCAALDGWVATAAEWLESGIHPQQPPNENLACDGWRCDCRLEKTDAPSMGVPSL